MAQDTMRKRISAAREEIPQAYNDMLNDTINSLPPIKRRTRLQYAVPIAATVALALALVFAGPPIARAAVSLFERLFAQQAQSLSMEQVRSAEERAIEMAKEVSEYGFYNQTYDDVSATVQGMQARLAAVAVRPGDGGGYAAQIVVGYTDVPEGFDPAWIDYNLSVGDTEFAANLDDGTKSYRREGMVSNEDSIYTPWQYEDGVMKHYISFPIGEINLDSPLDMTLSAQLNTVGEGGAYKQALGELRLNCVFDREIAAAQELERSRAAIPLVDEYLNRTQKQYEALALEAVPINADYTAEGLRLTVNEMSVMDNQIYFTASIKSDTIKLMKAMMLIESVRVDGKAPAFGGRTEEDISTQDGIQTIMHSSSFPADPRKLPRESVIYVEFSQEVGGGAVIFRYDWETRTVTLPADEKQASEWFLEERKLAETLFVNPNQEHIYDLHALCEKNGAKVTLQSVAVSDRVRVDFAVDGKTLKKNLVPQDYSVAIDGLPVTQYMAFGQTMCQFALPMHPSEMADIVDITISIPLAFDDGSTETFDFAFTLNKAEARVFDWPEKR